jgi:hypothetical protein
MSRRARVVIGLALAAGLLPVSAHAQRSPAEPSRLQE